MAQRRADGGGRRGAARPAAGAAARAATGRGRRRAQPAAAATGSGSLTLPDLASAVERGDIDTVQVVFPDCYGRFMGKRVPGRFFLDSVAAQGMHACNYLLTVDMEMDVVAGYRAASWEQ